MSKSNGMTTVTPIENGTAPAEPAPYRPEASTVKVQETILRSLGEVVTEAARTGATYVSLADHYDRDKGTAVRYGHLVDAQECLEIAMTYLAQLKSAVSYHLRVEDDSNVGPWSDPQF